MSPRTSIATLSLAFLIMETLFAPAAWAVILEADFESAGDARLTYDTDTGLQWLDLEETLGLSRNEAEGTDFVVADGFGHADADEVEDLLFNAGFLAVNNATTR